MEIFDQSKTVTENDKAGHDIWKYREVMVKIYKNIQKFYITWIISF